jgi:hypothetical protein
LTERTRWFLVVLFAAAMAWVESAAVTYLRILVGRVHPYQPDPLPLAGNLGGVELVREVATLLMLFTVGALAGRTPRSRLAYSMIAFGVWDILYYVFLAIIGDWPRSVWDWDVLFLLPLPWWGPVLAPTSISALLIAGGTLVSQFDAPDRPVWPGRWPWRLSLAGAALALIVFMADALRLLGGGIEAVRAALPVRFDWPLFTPALVLMAAPLGDVVRQIRNRCSVGRADPEGAPETARSRGRASVIRDGTSVMAPDE